MKKCLAFILVVVMMLSLCACSTPEKAIVGKWKSNNTVLGVVTETTYTFNEDGTGTKSNVLDVEFTYSFTEDKLVITTVTLGIESSAEYTFEFSGDKLVLTSEKETINLEKVK